MPIEIEEDLPAFTIDDDLFDRCPGQQVGPDGQRCGISCGVVGPSAEFLYGTEFAAVASGIRPDGAPKLTTLSREFAAPLIAELQASAP